jgi:putative membrane protein
MLIHKYVVLVIKGMAMGAANVIPGVSGGTIALITGIFERLIHAIKSLNFKAIKYLLKGKLREFEAHTDFLFLLSILMGILIAIVSLARLLDYLFTNYPVYIWSYFFGLVLASIYFVGRTITRWTPSVVISFAVGSLIALTITFLSPATPNSNFLYLMLSGVAAVCSMILPGLSGSFVLVLMGNYQLVAIEAINNRDLAILFPVILGGGLGLLAFSHFLSWLLNRYKNQTIALLTGFILGSLSVLWPWKQTIWLTNEAGLQVIRNNLPVVERYQPVLPETFDSIVIFAALLMIAGILTIWAVESSGAVHNNKGKA